MKISTILGLMLFPIITFGFNTPVEAPEAPLQRSITEMIDYLAPRFNQAPELIYKITYCESKHKIVSHDKGRGTNITGIHDDTFNRWLPLYEKEQGETLDKNSTYDQIKMISWAFSKGDDYRNQWTTYRAYKNGGEYTFYSKLLKGWYTARCK